MTQLAIRLHKDDNIAITRMAVRLGGSVLGDIVALNSIPAGHKVAIRAIAPGEPVSRYGQIIGFATQPIVPGEHVHLRNMALGDFNKDYAYGRDAKPTEMVERPATFQGIRRRDGRVATRNYVGIISSVNCSAHVAQLVADVFKRNPFADADPLAKFSNLDGVVALTHKTGCGMTGGEPLAMLRRTLGGYARHANFSHIIVLGLGCEVNSVWPAVCAAWMSRRWAARGARSKRQSASCAMCWQRQTTYVARRCRPASSWSGCSAVALTVIPGSPPIRL
jgi:altronate hydrolase